MANLKELGVIQEEFEKMYPGQVIKDGIVNPDLFKSAKYKILWILKETNHPQKDDSWTMPEFMGSSEILRKYPNWRRTYKLIIKTSYAFLHGITEQSQIPSEGEQKSLDILSSVALINISKVGGGASHDDKLIAACFQRDHNLLERQIKAIEPDVVINCTRVDKIKDLLDVKICKAINRFYIGANSHYKYIHAYSPNCRMKHELYLETMLACAKNLNL